MKDSVSVYPADRGRWEDLLTLFGPVGAYWNCWCLYWRFAGKEFNQLKKNEKIIILKNFIDDESYVPGLLAYIDNRPVGWIGFSKRTHFERLLRSRVIKAIDDLPVWSLVCFFIHKDYRGKGIATSLIRGAIDYVNSNNIPAIECYPVDTKGEKVSQEAGYVGTVQMFEQEGFQIVGNTKSTTENKPRVIMRYYAKP